MNAYGSEEVTEYLPDDPLAYDSDIAQNQLLHKFGQPAKRLNKNEVQSSIKATKTNQKSNYTCAACTLEFTNRSLLNVHQKTIHHQQYECYVCHQSFNRKSNLITHSRSHHTQTKPFRCKYCSLSFVRTTELLKHVIFHTGDTRNQCRQCKAVLSSQERLEKHKKTHSVSGNFQCHMCGANGFESKKTLSSHLRLHTKAGADKNAKRSSLNDGVNNKDKVGQTFGCELCEKRFTRKSNFMAHVKRHYSNQITEPVKVKSHLCCICGKLFSYRTHLIRHLYIHDGRRPYKCEYCGSDFTQSGGLMKHIEKHKRDAKLTIGIC